MTKTEQIIEMKSPFTGGKVTLENKETEVDYRGEKIKVNRQYYRCADTGKEFTDSKLDDDFMWSVFRAYWQNKNVTHFSDIDLYKHTRFEGWIARDSYGRLWIHDSKPQRIEEIWSSDKDIWSIPDKWFPELTWNDEPKHIQFIIKEL